MAIAANSDFKLASVDIRAAFLQSRTLDRDVFMLSPPNIKNRNDLEVEEAPLRFRWRKS